MGRKDRFTSDEDANDKLVAPPDFDGPVTDRRCTDILCLIMLWASWIAMSAVGAFAVKNGDYRVVLRPMDYDGNICGTDYGEVDMTEFGYLYYVNSYSGGVCVKECPAVPDLADPYTAVTYGGIYQTEDATLGPDAIQVANYSYSKDAVTCENLEGGINTCYPFGDARLSWTAPAFNRGLGYAYYALDTVEVLWRCIPRPAAIARLNEETRWPDDVDPPERMNATLVNETAAGAGPLDVASDEFSLSNLFADLWTARAWIMGFGFGVSLFVGLVYTFFLRIPGVLRIMVWGSILATVVMFLWVGYISLEYANRKSAEDPVTINSNLLTSARIAAYVLWVLGVLLFVLSCCLRKQIKTGMGCVKEASKSIAAMPLLILLPIVQAIGFIIFMVAFLNYGIHLASLGHLETREFSVDSPFGDSFSATVTVRNFEYDPNVEKLGWYLLFCLYWTAQFIFAMGEIIIATAVSRWYFTRDKKKVGNTTVIRAICSASWHHAGTAAFGSLLIAIVRIIRTIVAKLQQKAERLNASVAKVLLCCCQCLLWCFEKCLRYLNKNAYIQTAIFGTSFCSSARRAFFLIVRNAARISAITFISTVILFIGRLFITTVTCGAAYYFLETQLEGQLHSPIGPVVFVALMGYFVGGLFMSVFDLGITTVLHCFIADEEMFSDTGNMYAEKKLSKWIDAGGKDEEDEGRGGGALVVTNVARV